jgi:lipoyl(octanoyl) transferase
MNSSLRLVDLGLRDYEPVLKLQTRLAEQRRLGAVSDTLILVEHNPVYTMGRSARENNILVPLSVFNKMGVKVIRTGRGGDVTYHGPGQLVAYPIVDLAGKKLGVLDYVQKLEEVVILTLSDFGIRANADSRNRGVWIGNDKIAALGVKISHHITMHGFALNVCVDLAYYRHIVPCGIKGRGVVSMNLLVNDVKMDMVKKRAALHFANVFQYASYEHAQEEC